MLATSTGSGPTGTGGTLIIGDDVVSPAESDSKAGLASAIRWWDETLGSRLHTFRPANGRPIASTGLTLVVAGRRFPQYLHGASKWILRNWTAAKRSAESGRWRT